MEAGDIRKRIEEARQTFQLFSDKEFRDQQVDALDYVLREFEDGKRMCVLNAPPGSGKSLIGMVLARLFNATYLCSSKILQDQIEVDFPESMIMKGRNNYPCVRSEGLLQCDMCTHTKRNKCEFKGECRYEVQKNLVLRHPIRILNYPYYLTETNYIGKFAGSRLVICDEADTLKDHIANFIQLEVPLQFIDAFRLGKPDFKTTSSERCVDSWKTWAAECVGKLEIVTRQMQYQVDDFQGDRRSETFIKMIKRLDRVKGYINRFRILLRFVDDQWVWQEFREKWLFRPIWLNEELSEEYFFRFGERYVLMSGTFPPPMVLSKQVGFPVADMVYKEVPSLFPVENRWVIMRPRYELKRDTFDYEKENIKREIKHVLDRHPAEKGIVHAVSYKLANLVMEIGDPRLVTHTARDRDEVIAKFKESEEYPVLVSPIITRGVDLPDDLCRFIIWAKAPFLDLSDEVTKRRAYSGKFGNFWYKSETAQTIIQGAGRGMRHFDDQCTTYILDSLACKMIQENYRLFPGWFRDSLVEE